MSLAEQLQAVEVMDLFELREEWRRRCGAPPKGRAVELLRLSLAWRIQTAAYGGLDPATRQRLKADGEPKDVLAPGTRLVREWAGVRHEVEVADGRFIYGGRTWKSLSHIAREITGTRWNGPRFFGLRGEPPQ